MKKAGRCIQTPSKIFACDMLSLCSHNVCEEVRTHFPKVDRLIAKMKKTFLKCPKRIAILNKKCPDIPNPHNQSLLVGVHGLQQSNIIAHI